jgi:hypothetical protein
MSAPSVNWDAARSAGGGLVLEWALAPTDDLRAEMQKLFDDLNSGQPWAKIQVRPDGLFVHDLDHGSRPALEAFVDDVLRRQATPPS